MRIRLKSDQCIVYSSLKHQVHKACNPKPWQKVGVEHEYAKVIWQLRGQIEPQVFFESTCLCEHARPDEAMCALGWGGGKHPNLLRRLCLHLHTSTKCSLYLYLLAISLNPAQSHKLWCN